MTLAGATADLEQIKADLHDNADYFAEDDVTKAKAFLTALTRAIALYPRLVSKNREQELAYDLVTLRDLQKDVSEFVARKRNAQTGKRFRYAQFEKFNSRFGD